MSGGIVGRTIADDVVTCLEGVRVADAVAGSINVHSVVVFTDVSMACGTLDKTRIQFAGVVLEVTGGFGIGPHSLPGLMKTRSARNGKSVVLTRPPVLEIGFYLFLSGRFGPKVKEG